MGHRHGEVITNRTGGVWPNGCVHINVDVLMNTPTNSKDKKWDTQEVGMCLLSPISLSTEWPLLRLRAKCLPQPHPCSIPVPQPQSVQNTHILRHQQEPCPVSAHCGLFISSPPHDLEMEPTGPSPTRKNVGKFIYFSKTFLICNVLSKNVLADQAPAIFSLSI
jgi:hypothetical protein